MKLYVHFSLEGFANSYLVGNDETGEAILIDPGKMTPDMLNHIESNGYTLAAILITHNHISHCQGLSTLMKIYRAPVYAADFEIEGVATVALKGDGVVRIAGFTVGHLSVPGHTSDSVVYKIAHMLFTGDTVCAGLVGSTNNSYADRTLRTNLQMKILSQQPSTLILPGHGPPSTVATEKRHNLCTSFQPPADARIALL